MPTQASKNLEIFDNPQLVTDYTIKIKVPEFTCLCPKTGQPDFATIHIHYVPGQHCVELKSLKLYMWSFREEGKFHEAVTNEILQNLVDACSPKYMKVTAEFYVRGGIYTDVVTEYSDSNWTPKTPVYLP